MMLLLVLAVAVTNAADDVIGVSLSGSTDTIVQHNSYTVKWQGTSDTSVSVYLYRGEAADSLGLIQLVRDEARELQWRVTSEWGIGSGFYLVVEASNGSSGRSSPFAIIEPPGEIETSDLPSKRPK